MGRRPRYGEDHKLSQPPRYVWQASSCFPFVEARIAHSEPGALYAPNVNQRDGSARRASNNIHPVLIAEPALSMPPSTHVRSRAAVGASATVCPSSAADPAVVERFSSRRRLVLCRGAQATRARVRARRRIRIRREWDCFRKSPASRRLGCKHL
jgi:hypothetical protein